MINTTIEKFGYPVTLIREYEQWVILLRPAQITLGSMVVAAKSDATDFGDLSAEAFAELKQVSGDVSAMLGSTVRHDKLNWLMLMMVDPHVHYHIIPRYEGSRGAAGLTLSDADWPGPPDLKRAKALDTEQIAALIEWIRSR